MLQWMPQTLMQVEAENKVGAEKGKRATNRCTFFSGYRWRRFNARRGTIFLCVPNVRNGGYIPFRFVARERSEKALIQVV
jgi:putative transposase